MLFGIDDPLVVLSWRQRWRVGRPEISVWNGAFLAGDTAKSFLREGGSSNSLRNPKLFIRLRGGSSSVRVPVLLEFQFSSSSVRELQFEFSSSSSSVRVQFEVEFESQFSSNAIPSPKIACYVEGGGSSSVRVPVQLEFELISSGTTVRVRVQFDQFSSSSVGSPEFFTRGDCSSSVGVHYAQVSSLGPLLWLVLLVPRQWTGYANPFPQSLSTAVVAAGSGICARARHRSKARKVKFNFGFFAPLAIHRFQNCSIEFQ